MLNKSLLNKQISAPSSLPSSSTNRVTVFLPLVLPRNTITLLPTQPRESYNSKLWRLAQTRDAKQVSNLFKQTKQGQQMASLRLTAPDDLIHESSIFVFKIFLSPDFFLFLPPA